MRSRDLLLKFLRVAEVVLKRRFKLLSFFYNNYLLTVSYDRVAA